jgi:dTDP-4-amino-4,6-dideoxygalactose transaminase
VLADPRLAIGGGRPAVSGPYRERWRQVRTRDVVTLARYARRGVNTMTKGEGPVAEFERRFARLAGTRHALAMNSGTGALHSAYFAVGVVPGSEVIVPAYTFFASAAPILQCGAKPVFCDVDARTLTADPDDVERCITARTRAICVVHMWGNPAALDRLRAIADRHKLALIEDCSHAHGASYRGRPVGSWGDVGCFSLQGSKAVSGGEAGIAVTSDPTLFDRMLLLGHYGRLKKGQAADTFHTDYLSLGVKYRPHLYAILLANGSLSRLPELNRLRRRNFAILAEELHDCPAVQPIETAAGGVRGGFLEYILRYDQTAGGLSREEFIAAASAEGVPIAPERYAALGKRRRMLHESPIFAGVDIYTLAHDPVRGLPHAARRLPVTEALRDSLVTLPPFTKVPERYVRQCARALRKVAEAGARTRARQGDDTVRRDGEPAGRTAQPAVAAPRRPSPRDVG